MRGASAVKPAIGFVGLGTMGRPMATNLVRAGFDVTVYDVDQDPVNALVELGARAAASLHELGQHCDVIEIAVWDDAGVESVMTGSGADGGVLESARPGSTVVVHSTISVATCRKLAEAARERDVHVLDAAMSGGAARAPTEASRSWSAATPKTSSDARTSSECWVTTCSMPGRSAQAWLRSSATT